MNQHMQIKNNKLYRKEHTSFKPVFKEVKKRNTVSQKKKEEEEDQKKKKEEEEDQKKKKEEKHERIVKKLADAKKRKEEEDQKKKKLEEPKEKSLDELMTNDDREMIKTYEDKIKLLQEKLKKAKSENNIQRLKENINDTERKLEDFKYSIAKRSPLFIRGREKRSEYYDYVDTSRNISNKEDKLMFQEKAKKAEKELEILKDKFEKHFNIETFFGSGVSGGVLRSQEWSMPSNLVEDWTEIDKQLIKYAVKDLRYICRLYNIHNRIDDYTSLSKETLIKEMRKHMSVKSNGEIEIKKQELNKDVKNSVKKVVNFKRGKNALQ
jgi:hypothetical protein